MPQDPAVTAIMNAAGRYPVLPPAQQLFLARQVRSWLDWPADAGPCPTPIEARGRKAKQRLLETNIRLIVTIANKLAVSTNTRAELADLIQEGTLGLNRAIEKFDPARGYQFSTYAYFWCRQSIGRAAKRDSSIYIPEGAQALWSTLSKLITSYEQKHGYRPSIDWLIAESGLSRRAIERCIVIGQVRSTKSLDAHLKGSSGDDASTLLDLVVDHHDDHDDEPANDSTHRTELLHQLLSQLPERDRDIIHRIDLQGQRHADLSASYGLSRSRIGQLHRRAHERLQELADQHLTAA
jgi:RNA polymerase sigma factor (sigma-70 family)